MTELRRSLMFDANCSNLGTFDAFVSCVPQLQLLTMLVSHKINSQATTTDFLLILKHLHVTHRHVFIMTYEHLKVIQ